VISILTKDVHFSRHPAENFDGFSRAHCAPDSPLSLGVSSIEFQRGMDRKSIIKKTVNNRHNPRAPFLSQMKTKDKCKMRGGTHEQVSLKSQTEHLPVSAGSCRVVRSTSVWVGDRPKSNISKSSHLLPPPLIDSLTFRGGGKFLGSGTEVPIPNLRHTNSVFDESWILLRKEREGTVDY
jgi:hypothetical protein